MKNNSPTLRFRRLAGAFLMAVLPAMPLRAQQGPPVVIAPDTSITLPPGWKITSQNPPADKSQDRAVSTDPKGATLLLTAAPADAGRGVTFSLFCVHFHEWGPPIESGNMGAESESEKIVNTVLMQGYTPSAIRVIPSSSPGRPMITIEVTARNATGDQRIFSDTATAWGPFATKYRLYASRPASDAAGAQEIAAIAQSLVIPHEGPVGSAQAANATPAANPIPGIPSIIPGIPAPSQPSSPSAPLAAGTPAGQPPATPNAAAAPADNSISAQTSQLVSDYHGSLLMVEGQKGVGSGFLCNLGGHTYAITNAHVLSDNIGIKITTLDGKVLQAGASGIAVGHDIVRMEVPATSKPFEVMTNIESTARIGDAVTVLGNAEGERVVRPVDGKIVGIGPNLIEVDAPFVKGNSGSPIIHRATGKVLGIATYMVEKKVNQGGSDTVTVETRRFGYRLDSVEQWQAINWQAFFVESAQVAKIEELSQDFIKMFEDNNKSHKLYPENYTNPSLQRAVRSFYEEAGQAKRNASIADKEEILRRFFADLRSISKSDVQAFNTRNSYDYFNREIEDQERFRGQIYDLFTRLMQSHN